MRTPRSALLILVSLTVPNALAIEPVFNWVPSGVIDVGDRASEAAAGYEGVGPLTTIRRGYRDQAPRPVDGRTITGAETFTVRPAAWRGGPATSDLVLVATVDTEAVPGPLTVSAGKEVLGTWHIDPPGGPARLYDAYFVIPNRIYPDGRVPRQYPLTIAGDGPRLSLGYRLYATRDFESRGLDLSSGLDVLRSGLGPIEEAPGRDPWSCRSTEGPGSSAARTSRGSR